MLGPVSTGADWLDSGPAAGLTVAGRPDRGATRGSGAGFDRVHCSGDHLQKPIQRFADQQLPRLCKMRSACTDDRGGLEDCFEIEYLRGVY